MTSIPENSLNDNAVTKCCEIFFKQFKLNQILRRCNAVKQRGASTYMVFSFLVGLVFTGKNFYRLIQTQPEKVPFGKDTVYRFMDSPSINWEGIVTQTALTVLDTVDKLTSKDRKSALIFDDSSFYRNRSKKVELLSRCYDHVEHAYYKGYTMLTLGWSDGQTFLPLQFQLVASANDKNLLTPSFVKEDKRTLATTRRINARKDKPQLVLDMLDATTGTAAQAQYVLFDSWFSSNSALLNIHQHGYDVVARLKKHPNFHYSYQGESLCISKIYAKCKKRRGMSRYLLSVVVDIEHKDFQEKVPAKIVYVKDKNNRKNWIALISTDTTLSEDEIIALYGKRWDIEPFFKVLKSHLNLETEFQSRSFDAITAHTAIVFIRYIMLSFKNREGKDQRTICELCFVMNKELEDISFAFAFQMIIDTMKKCVGDSLHLPQEQILALVDDFMARLPLFIKGKLPFVMCES